MFWRNKKMLVSAVVILLLCLFTPTSKVHFFWERFPLFYAVFGFVGCIVFILIAKALGKLFIQRDENYYE
jgi:uncharacterized membrane protein YhfC